MKSVAAITAALAALGVALNKPSLKAVNFNFSLLKEFLFDCAGELKAAGFDSTTLKGAGYDVAALTAAGFDATALKAAGFSVRDITFAGLESECCVVRLLCRIPQTQKRRYT